MEIYYGQHLGLTGIEEDLFVEFLEAYLENVCKELPQSFRARQIQAGCISKQAVYEFETRFLLEPFVKAIREIKSD